MHSSDQLENNYIRQITIEFDAKRSFKFFKRCLTKAAFIYKIKNSNNVKYF